MNNSEILYLYDAKLTNPNGDPDEENRPRMDYEREINLVSDLRLKRYVRDYMLEKGIELFVQRVGEGEDEKPVTAEERVNSKTATNEEVLERFADVRLFGATMPIKGGNKQFIGPVQFNWGYSLNKVALLESSITSTFTAKSGNTQGTIGKDYRVKYSFLAFSGVVSGNRGDKTNLREEDIEILDKAMRYAIPAQITRSKIGQYPRLYLRVQYKDKETILGDMRDCVQLNYPEDVRDVKETSLEISGLISLLSKNKERIDKIMYYYDDKLKLVLDGNEISFAQAFKDFTMSEVK